MIGPACGKEAAQWLLVRFIAGDLPDVPVERTGMSRLDVCERSDVVVGDCFCLAAAATTAASR